MVVHRRCHRKFRIKIVSVQVISLEITYQKNVLVIQELTQILAKAQQKMNNLTVGRQSWHEHVYEKLSNRPTPHFIEDILGIQNSSSKCNDEEETLKSKLPVNSSDSVVPDCASKLIHPQELNEPLNLSTRSEKVRPKTNCKESVRKRKPPRELETKIVSSTVANPSNSVAEDGDSKKKKKARTTFTGQQIFELEKQFEIKKYLSSSERSEMAKLLNVTETQGSRIIEHLFTLSIYNIYVFWNFNLLLRIL
ncbi:hypothetical protein FQR65_LT04179 [Abscondita terminalis]|nr:hypothetical protein FQR65_LT04179 [Abscondita terminalis]